MQAVSYNKIRDPSARHNALCMYIYIYIIIRIIKGTHCARKKRRVIVACQKKKNTRKNKKDRDAHVPRTAGGSTPSVVGGKIRKGYRTSFPPGGAEFNSCPCVRATTKSFTATENYSEVRSAVIYRVAIRLSSTFNALSTIFSNNYPRIFILTVRRTTDPRFGVSRNLR